MIAVLVVIACGRCGKSWGKFWEIDSTTQSVLNIADTGQIQCSSTASADGAMSGCPQTVTGQDGDYVNIPRARSFSGPTASAAFVSDFTTTDNVTGLVWKSCSEGPVSGASCSGTPTGTYTQSAAIAACSTLNSGAGYAGYSQWRLPTIEELKTIPNYGIASPSIDLSYFPGTQSNFYWTSSTYAPTAGNGWFVNFYDGNSDTYSETTASYVRCVAAGTPAAVRIYADNNNGTVSDQTTGLLWQKCSAGLNNDSSCSGGPATVMQWTSALSYCTSLSLAGKTWRLPNLNEIKRLVDTSGASAPFIDTAKFPATTPAQYWSSTTYALDVTRAWAIQFNNAAQSNDIKGNPHAVRCVTGP